MDSDDLWRMIANAFLIVVAVGAIFWFVAKPLEKAIMGNSPQTPAQTETQTTTTTGSPATGIPVQPPNNTLPTATPMPSQGAPLGTTSPAPAQTMPVQPQTQTAPATTE